MKAWLWMALLVSMSAPTCWACTSSGDVSDANATTTAMSVASRGKRYARTPSTLAIEQRLAERGFDPGPIDGIFDEATRRALMRFQIQAGLPSTGFPDSETVRRLFGR